MLYLSIFLKIPNLKFQFLQLFIPVETLTENVPFHEILNLFPPFFPHFLWFSDGFPAPRPAPPRGEPFVLHAAPRCELAFRS